MYYPDDLVEEIRLRNDIVDVIGSYIHLKKSGANHVGLCPFHNEKTGSFSVNGQRQIFKCFGCGVGGNVLTFVMKYENMTFPEAIKVLADRAGVKLPEMELSEAEKRANFRKNQILQINKEAAKYYFSALRAPQGKIGLDYLKERGLSDDTIKNFGLGFAVPSNNGLYSYLKSLPEKYNDEILMASGIFTYNERQGARDKFWNRVIFPIMDVNNKVIAFGGRVMAAGAIEEGDKKIPKYLNSPETEVFDKSRSLYGLNIAKRTKADSIILCEGYMDVIALHQAGFDQAAASLGTAFTSGHANLLRRYSKKVYLSYDSDEAGIKAALRAIPILKSAGISAKVINMAPYKDPDEFIKNLGAEEYQKRIDNAEPSFFFEIRMLEREYDLNDPGAKTQFCREIAIKIAGLEESIERSNYTNAICGKYGLKPQDLGQLVEKEVKNIEFMPEYNKPKSGIHTKEKTDGVENARKENQKLLLSWICNDIRIYSVIREYIIPADFVNELYIKVAEILFDKIDSGSKNIDVASIITCFTEEDEQTEVHSLLDYYKDDYASATDKSNYLKQLLVSVLGNSADKLNKSAKEAAGEEKIQIYQRVQTMNRNIEMIKSMTFKID